MVTIERDETYLAHHGVKGQKWGRRRYQNEDGSYKPGAEGRYYDEVDGGGSKGSSSATPQKQKKSPFLNPNATKADRKQSIKNIKKGDFTKKDVYNYEDAVKAKRSKYNKVAVGLIAGAGVASVAAAAAYGVPFVKTAIASSKGVSFSNNASYLENGMKLSSALSRGASVMAGLSLGSLVAGKAYTNKHTKRANKYYGQVARKEARR